MSRARELSKLANPSVFSVDSNNNVGVNSTTPDAKLDVVGVVSATQFFGDGSELSGITAGATLSAGSGDQRVVITSLTSGTMTAAATDAELSYNSNTNTLSATNISIAGTLTYEDVTNVDSVGVVTARSGLRVVGGGLTVTGVSTFFNTLNLGNGSTNVLSLDADNSQNSVISHLGSGSFTVKTNNANDILIWADHANGDITLRRGTGVGVVNVLTTSSTGISVTGTVTATGGVQVGSGQSFGANGPTAVYYGDGSQLTGISAGGISTFAGTASGIVTTLNLTNQDHKLTVTGITTITVTGGTEGDSHTVRIVNSGIATVGFSTYFLFPSGSAPSVPTADGAISLISFTVHRAGSTGIATQLLGGAALNFS